MKTGKFVFRTVMYEATRRCNLACRYCYNDWNGGRDTGGHRRRGTPEDSYSENLRTLKQLFGSAAVRHVGFTGGEPFLAERLAELVLFCRLHGAAVSIVSNGNCADQAAYRQMIELGVNQFTIPLHAAEPEIHDRMTGCTGSWYGSVRSIRQIVEMGGRVVASVVITSENHDQVAATLTLCKKLGIKRAMINRFNIGGRGIREAGVLSAAPQQLREAFAAAEAVGPRLGLRLSSNVAIPHCLVEPRDYPHIPFVNCSGDLADRPWTLEPGGDLRACNHSPVVVGNIFAMPMAQILDTAAVRSWQTTAPDACRDCDKYSRCLGGCRAAAEQVGMSLGSVDPILDLFAADRSSVRHG